MKNLITSNRAVAKTVATSSLFISFLTAATLSTAETKIVPSKKAHKIAQDTIIVDGHIDVPYRLEDGWVDVTKATKGGDFDYPRAMNGGLNAPFMSIYIPASYEKKGGGEALADRLIDRVEAIVGRAPDKFAIATSVADVKQHFKKGVISLPMGMENGTPINGSIDNLKHFYYRGIRYITLAHSLSNHISDSSYDLRRQWKGLSPFGKELVSEMNKIGMMVDISHVSDDAFYQALKITKAPVIASHSSLRKFTPGFERNMDDDMLKALAKNKGVIMINFGSGFVTSSARLWSDKLKAKITEANTSWGTPEAEKIEKKFKQNNKYPFATLENVLDHIDHVRDVVGVDYIGIGSDFDGVGDSLPKDLKDVSYFPHLVQGLMDRGYSEKDIKKILSGNLLRVWSEVERVAKQS